MVTEEEWHGDGEGKAPSLHQPLAGLVVLGIPPCRRLLLGGPLVRARPVSVTAGVLIAIILPLVCVLVIVTDRQQRKTDDKVRG